MNENFIKLKKANLGYGHDEKHIVLNDINIDFLPGTITAIVGPNGAGKSTLINSIVGVLPPLSGKIEFKVTNDLNQPNFNKVGFCPQVPLIDWFTSVKNNVILGPLLSGKTLKKSRKLSISAMKQMQIYDLRNRPMDHISGGQQQRVQIARELAKNPDVFILDEPTTGLDVYSSEKLFKFLKTKSIAGSIVIISSHDLTIVEEYADKIVLIGNNKVKFNGLMSEFIQKGARNKLVEITPKSGNFSQVVKQSVSTFKESDNGNLIINFSEFEKFMNVAEKNNEVIDYISMQQKSLRDIYLDMSLEK
ncbi:Manganese ABC transporter, ATP-binding protein SitB [Fructilactobacillus florum 8D]|uniref:Manganese ABC transporter, ATP-binding protein SitB n=1 Tax=Fructilactobacillus florum 8D TaxID=1221538 RepID=W9EHS8_9LACO|nr:ATP-binding cassette domain-containing protein [Fructilactobacillus florum]EKK20583.1 Manganese ABC transporter, ATP-binding protein SitB [Fructilactobacillus florum 2F]ETO40811.1 Manganese ABC transporter, ATP-binding protein SitB [Fructilactobacillus florum 8D]